MVVEEGSPAVWDNVRDQLILWENEVKRVQYTAIYLYSDFDSAEEYVALKSFAAGLNGLAYADDATQRLGIQAKFHPEVKEFIKQRKSAAEG